MLLYNICVQQIRTSTFDRVHNFFYLYFSQPFSDGWSSAAFIRFEHHHPMNDVFDYLKWRLVVCPEGDDNGQSISSTCLMGFPHIFADSTLWLSSFCKRTLFQHRMSPMPTRWYITRFKILPSKVKTPDGKWTRNTLAYQDYNNCSSECNPLFWDIY